MATEATETKHQWRLNEDAVGIACPVCKKEKAKVARIGIREDLARPVFQCGHCAVGFIENGIGDLREYYRNGYRDCHEGSPHEQGVPLDPSQRWVNQYRANASAAKDFKETVPKGGAVLEIGCSAGGFLSHINDDWECFGSEWNPEDARFVREVGELPCEEGDVTEVYPGKTFSAIVALHVLEHQADPTEFLRQCRDRLIGGGYLFLEVPNLSNSFLSLYKLEEFSLAWHSEAHITYWTPEILGGLVATMGFEARLWTKQRSGISTAMRWLTRTKGSAMAPFGFASVFEPVPRDHPASGLVNRLWGKLDWEYRLQMENMRIGDVIRVMGRRQQI